MGLSLLAIQTGVKTGILLNHIPRYQPREEEEDKVLDFLTMVSGAGWNWKKPSANLPFLDMSLSPTTSGWPAERVSPPFAIAAGEVCREEERRNP